MIWMPMESSPVFIHSSFRVGSTWLWNCFRMLPNVVAYYEIFHEKLGFVTQEEVEQFTPESWESRHPATRPYFEEYLPLIKSSGGVRGFETKFSYWRAIPEGGAGGDISKEEIEYINLLINNAESKNKVPVITCGRTLARVRGINKTIGGVHILLIRDLFNQWSSYISQGGVGNYYFQNSLLSILFNGSHDTILNRIKDKYTYKEICRDGSVLGRFYEIEHNIISFLGLHIYLYLVASLNCCHIIDISELSKNSASVIETENLLFEMTGLDVSLGTVFDKPMSVAVKIRNLNYIKREVYDLFEIALDFLQFKKQNGMNEWVRKNLELFFLRLTSN